MINPRKQIWSGHIADSVVACFVDTLAKIAPDVMDALRNDG